MLFLPITMILYRLGRRHLRCKNIVLLAASILFYAWGEPFFVLILLMGICVNYGFGMWLGRAEERIRRPILWLSVLYNVGILFIFKYLNLVSEIIGMVVPAPATEIPLPIGISFYTFQMMSYVFDVYYRKVPEQHNPFHLALYVSMFPQLVAGPIVRYSDISDEIESREESVQQFGEGLERFAIGLAKKVLLADLLGEVADRIFAAAHYGSIPSVTAWIGALAYTFEIYYDFSGYSDMAIGLGLCFGFHFPENFNYPYISRSITEFWRRWHISLTSWFRDYVYIPLGGNRVKETRHIRNLFTVWLLTGIWHGAGGTFLLWGMLYFILQLFEKKAEWPKRIPAVPGYFLTALTVTLCWVIFRAENMGDAIRYLRAMFGFRTEFCDVDSIRYIKSTAVLFLLAWMGSFPIFPALKKLGSEKTEPGNGLAAAKGIWCLAMLILSLTVIISGSYSPFIYFNF